MHMIRKTKWTRQTASLLVCAAMALLAFAAAPSQAHTEHQKKSAKQAASQPAEETAFGRQGNPGQVDRTITVDMDDRMRFSPGTITVKQGQTVRFIVRNKGKILHEMVLGTMQELQEHGEMMKKYPDMEHDDPHAVHVKAGKKEDLVWHFTKAGEFYYACLLPGHFEAGMVGKIIVTKG